MTPLGIAFQRWTLAALLPLAAIVFWSGAGDPVNVTKATVAASGALLLLAVGAVRVAVLRRLTVPVTPALIAAAVLAAGFLVATVASDVPGASFAGNVGRADGFLLYGSCIALFLIGLRVLEPVSAQWVVRGLLAGGAVAATYGMLQYAGVDPIHWANADFSPVIGTFGNPDFESAYLGIALPAAAWGALTATWALPWRIAAGVLAVGCLVVALLSSSVQGPLGGAAGLLVILVAFLLNRGGTTARWGVLLVTAGGGLVGLVVLLGIGTGIGPGDRVVSAESLTARKWYWSSAWRLWRHHPLAGVGLDRYGAYYRSARPAAAAAVNNYSDAAHSVPLHLLATGGLAVALPYLAVVGCVAFALVVGLRRQQGEARMLLAAAGGAWVAYQAQSLVSIDQPGLAVTHWVLAAAVVVLGSPPRLHERLLPGAPSPQKGGGRRTRAALASQPTLSAATFVACSVVAVVAVVSLWQVWKPLRASHASRTAALELVKGNGNAAFDAFNAAARLAPYANSYWFQKGKFLEQVKQPALAAAAYRAGADHDPWAYDVLVAGAALAKTQHEQQALDRYSRLLGRVDPSGGWRKAIGD